MKKIIFSVRSAQQQINMYLIASAVLVVAAGVWGYFQFVQLSTAWAAIDAGKSLETRLTQSNDEFKKAYVELNTASKAEYKSILDGLAVILPNSEQYTELTRTFDKYFYDQNSAVDPIFMNDLRFSKPKADKNSEYSVLPFAMTITSTENKLDDFLRYIEGSGSLEEPRTRLMDIQSISLNLPVADLNAADGTVEPLDVSIAGNAYFQKMVEEKKVVKN